MPAQLRHRAAERPQDIAHRVVGGEDLTFADWEVASNRAAHGLIERGVRPGERVLLPCSTGTWIDYAVAWAAVLKAGAVAVPLHQSAGAERMASTARESGAVCAVGGGPVPLPDTPQYTVAVLADGQPTGSVDVSCSAGDDAEIIYTSGTTGVPRGVVATHENLLYPLRGSRARQARTALHALPPATTVGQGLLIQPLCVSPHRTFTLGRFVPAEFLAAIEDQRPTDVVLVPAMAIALVNAATAGEHDLGCVRQVRTTSAPIHPATLEALARLFPTARIRNVYSTTECWPRRLATDFDRTRPTSLGRPAEGSEVRIVDGAGDVVPARTAGDVQLRSEAPQRRYDGEDLRSAVFLPGGWTRTGDVGLVDEDGYFYLVDRNPDLVNSGGTNVSTLDVEAAAMAYPGVIEAAVFGVPHPVLTESVVAAVRTRPGLDPADLAEHLRRAKGSAAPQRIVVVEDLPRNLLGKIDKKQLRKDFVAGTTAGGYEAPSTATEQLVAGLWASALDLDRVSAADDFLQIGGSSLTAMEVVAQVTGQLAKRVTVRDILDAPTLRAFAERVDAAPAVNPDDEAIVPVADGSVTAPR
ncbi:AMP-binding protein [Rugosimonospora acidiphila]|uniref:AMP-binding protein n=1 Tax=Rugosimonospora acidiphila TaxID=556531 RepID=UPI0031E863CE